MKGLRVLRRLAIPNRYTDIRCIFGRSKPELSIIFTYMIESVDQSFGYLLTFLDLCWLKLPDLQKFTHAIQRKGLPLPDIWGFIDGSFRPVCRPNADQRTLYSWHYRLHGIRFQSIMAPNGLVVNLGGPWVGRRHHFGMLADSGLLNLLGTKMNELGRIFQIYGDPAYPVSDYIEAPFRQGPNGFTPAR